MGRLLISDSATLATVLPIIGVDCVLPSGFHRKSLGSGFFLTSKNPISSLTIFSDEHWGRELSETARSHILSTDLYLGVTSKLNKDTDPYVVFDRCNERLDRFLLALNLNGKLWTFRPDIRFGWVKHDAPRNRQYFTVRHASPISTFDDKPSFSDLQSAGRLIPKIEKIYDATSETAYPAIRTAFAALRLGFYAFNTSVRFLQLAIALEALCSTSTTEVSHRIASTCSILNGGNAKEKNELYHKAKQLYGIRSRIIHGSGKRTTMNDVQEMEGLTCKLLRRILENKILPNFESRPKQKEFLLRITLTRMFRQP
jgi:hypothetical protein